MGIRRGRRPENALVDEARAEGADVLHPAQAHPAEGASDSVACGARISNNDRFDFDGNSTINSGSEPPQDDLNSRTTSFGPIIHHASIAIIQWTNNTSAWLRIELII